MQEKFLSKVYGYQDIKQELSLIRDWYLTANELGERRKLLPRGILFDGAPGVGKTHMIREFSKTFNFPVFVIKGNDDNVEDEVISIYEKAKKETNAIVVIDEIDTLIDKDFKLTRVLMTQLDGFDNANTILTLATCNHYCRLPDPLLRQGRFDRLFSLEPLEGEELIDVIKKFANDSQLNLSEDDVFELSEMFKGYTNNLIRAIFNNVSLKYGQNVKINEVINTADYIETGTINKKDIFVSECCAIHEAGHALYLYLYSKTNQFLRVCFDNDGGKTISCKKSDLEPIEYLLEDIKIALAGMAAEEIFFNKNSGGSQSDLRSAYNSSYQVLCAACAYDVKDYVPNIYNLNDFVISNESNFVNHKKIINFMKKNYKKVKRELKKHKNQILKVANYLLQHKEIKRKEFMSLI